MRKNILLTIKYFDIFDYPLQKEELWQWLFNFVDRDKLLGQKQKKFKQIEFEKELTSLIQAKKIVFKDGYYFLYGRQAIIKTRQARYQISLKKIKKARRIGHLLAWVPGVRMIAVVSNLGYLNADKQADIDLFIVARHNKIWSVRFWCVVLMKLLRQRPTTKKSKNKICLSYFVDENNLNLKFTALNELDIHLVYLLSQYILIYDQTDYWRVYLKQNRWIRNYLPNFNYGPQATKWKIKFRFEWLKKLLEKTELGFENRLYKDIQLGWMAPVLKSAMNRSDKKVIINDQILKLHTNDKREAINREIINFKL